MADVVGPFSSSLYCFCFVFFSFRFHSQSNRPALNAQFMHKGELAALLTGGRIYAYKLQTSLLTGSCKLSFCNANCIGLGRPFKEHLSVCVCVCVCVFAFFFFPLLYTICCTKRACRHAAARTAHKATPFSKGHPFGLYLRNLSTELEKVLSFLDNPRGRGLRIPGRQWEGSVLLFHTSKEAVRHKTKQQPAKKKKGSGQGLKKSSVQGLF